MACRSSQDCGSSHSVSRGPMPAYEGRHRVQVRDQDPRHARLGRNNLKGILKPCTGQKYGDHQVIEENISLSSREFSLVQGFVELPPWPSEEICGSHKFIPALPWGTPIAS